MEKNNEEEEKEKEKEKEEPLIKSEHEHLIVEGNAKFLIETKVSISQKEENYQAFYNPVQVYISKMMMKEKFHF